MKLKNKAGRGAAYAAQQPESDVTEYREEEREATGAPYKTFATKEEYEAELDRAIEEAAEDGAEMPKAEDGKPTEDQIIAGWKRGEKTLRTLVPGFELSAAMGDKAFAAALTGGMSVAEAYIAMTESRRKPAQTRREIAQNAQSANKGTGKSQSNPASLPPAEFNAYINRIMGN